MKAHFFPKLNADDSNENGSALIYTAAETAALQSFCRNKNIVLSVSSIEQTGLWIPGNLSIVVVR
jgi:hypothetical protein